MLPPELIYHVIVFFVGYCGLVGLFYVGKFFYTWFLLDLRKKKMEETIKRIATDFYYWWHNQPGTNAQQGFDDWWSENKHKYQIEETKQ